ncbi:MAG: Ig-like domain-containing protein [Thermoanaerobaculia bacterium]
MLLIAGMLATAATAQANITSTTLRIQGAGLRVVTESVTTSVDLPVTVQTEFGGKQNDEAIALEGVFAVGDLTGPGIETPIQLTTAPGGKFQVPGLAQQGVYYLQNVRLMKGGTFLQSASPATSVITVADLLQTKVTVKQLSADELRKRGITVDARNYNVYEYSFTFIIDGQTIVIPFPVIIDPRTHEVQPVASETPYSLPPQGLFEPPRWSPPQIIAMEFGEEGALPQPGEEPKERAQTATRSSIPAAIVIPNSLAVLHQFFAVAVMVTNGAPQGSAARLEELKATIKIPTALRTVKTSPQVSFGQAVPIVEPTTGVSFLIAQARGEAEWTLEGLEPGTHRLDFDLRAVLRQEGQVDTPMRATPSAAIVVHDPRFNINFSHPDTVRKGIEYSTYSFITNMSATDQTVTITSGVESCNVNPAANVCRLNGAVSDSLTIPAGDMRLIEYRLRASVTGHVFATAGTIGSTDNLSASVRLHMGVSESGIPLSPATLILPHYAEYLAPDVVSANLQLLGLGYSLATAPLNAMTAKFPRVIRTDVFQRAVDLARAGQRIFITDAKPEEKRDSIAHLALDLLGNGGYELREWDQLRRQENSGRTAGAAVIHELEASGFTFDTFASATAHRGGFVAALTNSGTIALQGRTSGRRTEHPNEATAWLRDIPFSDISRLWNGELALIARWTEDIDVKVAGATQLDLLYPDVDDGRLRRAHFELDGPVTISLTRGANSLDAIREDGTVAATGIITTVEPAPLRIAGARQDLHLDENGHKVSVLFNRPIDVQDGVDLRTQFTGRIDFNRDGVVYEGPRPISAAALQDDRRTVNTTFDHTLSQNATYKIDTAFAGSVTPKIDNDAPAGIVSGKVVKGDNTPIGGVDVTLRQYLPNDLNKDPGGAPQYDVSQADGAFFFEFVRRQIDAGWTGAYRVEGFSSVHGKTSTEASVRLPGEVRFISLQYLGRGAAQGTVKYNDGSVAANVTVTIGSTMFSQLRTSKSDAQGFYRIEDLPVGPLTFSAQDTAGNVTFAANEVATPGQLVTQNLSIFRQPFPGLGKVHGIVRRSDTNEAMPGVHVGVYSQGYGLTDGFTDANGHYEFDKVPAGFVSVLAEEWTVARQSVAIDLDLKANEVREANVLFLIQPALKFTTLTGEVWRENPLQPGMSERVPGALVKIDGYRVVTADAEGRFTYEELPLVFSGRNVTAYDPATQRVKTTVVPTLTEAGPNHVAFFINAFDRGEGKIRVHLLSAGGAPVAGYRVISPGFTPKLLQPAGVGVYELPHAVVGSTYEIRAVPSALRPADGTDERPYGDQMAGGQVRVEFNGHIAALTLRLPGEGTVRVKVRSQLDLISPVSLTYPVWYESEQGTGPLALEQSTEKNGEADRAVFTKIPALAAYQVASTHPQYGYAIANAQLGYDGAFNEHTLQLNTLATVRGTVYAIDGVTPVAGASVTIANGRSDPGSRMTGPDGRFEFTDQPSNTNVTVSAQVTQSEVFRVGFSTARTPPNGGVVENMAIVLRKRGLVDGQVVYKDYKRFDPDNAANNIADNTPNDYSDNAPVPLAKFYLRELDFPNRNFGNSIAPLRTDISGRFVINNVFVGSLRATGWDAGNEELRGDWTGRIDEEGQEALPKAYIAVTGGLGGVGSAKITVVDPNQSYAQVQNAEVRVYAGGSAFDFGSTDATGSVQFDQLPVGTYTVSAYSKALGKTSKSESISVPRHAIGTARLELEFSGTVDGTLKDPENANAPVPGSHVRLTASSYQTQSSTDVNGFFLFQGVREGSFALDAKDPLTNRRAHEERSLTVLDPHRTVNMLLEPTETLHFAAYLPDDFGNRSNVLAPPLRAEAIQRCYRDLSGARHCDYERQAQGNPIAFENALEQAGYEINAWQSGDAAPSINLGGTFPKGSAADPLIYVYPAYGEVRVTVTQAGAPANGAKVTLHGAGKSVTVYTDATGQVIVRGIRLGGVYVQAESIDGKFTGTASVSLQRQSIPAIASIALGTYAGVIGTVEAEAGGPSVGTRVVATFAGQTAEARTDGDGRYTFLGIPTHGSGTTTVTLVCIGPDDATVGGSTSTAVNAGDGVVAAPHVKLDATAPTIVSIIPADGAIDVSPDASITITFSEPLNPATILAANFQLVDTDTGTVNCALTSTGSTVTIKPLGGLLRSNTLHRVIVSSNVTDSTGHRLPSTRGFTFTTSDYAEPRVLKVLPASPIPAATTFEFRFNEPIDPAPWLTNGSGVFRVEKLVAPGGVNAAVERQLAARAFVDPTHMTLFIAPDDAIVAESFYRVTFSGVRDPQGNILGEQTFHFFSFDEVAPHVVLTAPPSSEQLVSGSEYEVRIELHNGSASGSIATDVKKVEYFTVATDGTETPFATMQQAPFFAKILGPEAPASGTMVTVGAQAYDASGNRGPKSTITWTVKPNAAPVNVAITPKQTSAYPSSTISALVTFADEGSFASVTMTFAIPKNNGTIETASVTRSYTRLANGAWPEVSFERVLSNDAKAGERVTLTASVTDVRGLTSTPVSATIEIAADSSPPNILSITPAANTLFLNKDRFVIEAAVNDAETGVDSVAFFVDGVSYGLASRVGQTFRSVSIEARAKAEDALIPIVVTAKDFNGNTRSKTHDVLYRGVNDPEAPKVAWICPIDRGALPALANGFALKLRLNVVDEDVRSVKFLIGSEVVSGALISGTQYGATYTFAQTPPAGPLTITAIVEDTVAAHTIELPITLDLVNADFTFTDPKAITAAEAATFRDTTIALIGSGAVLAPQVPLTLKNLLVLNGARVETLPSTITREFRVDITTTGVTYVDCDSSVNVSEKGYVGGWAPTSDGMNADAHGRTIGNTIIGGADSNSQGSHAGLGGVGTIGTTNAPYGSIFTPVDLGAGGGGASNGTNIGAPGGGAVALRGGIADNDASRIVIAGTLRADGGSAVGRWAAGAGGSVWLSAGQVLFGPLAQLSANGGDDDGTVLGNGGAGGGRVAMHASTKLELSTAVIEARGGRNVNRPEERQMLDGGAGTIYLRKPGQEQGELIVSSLDARFPASIHATRPTPFAGVLAFDRITAGPRALLVFNDHVSAGGVIDDRSGMTIDATAAVVLRDEQATLDIITTPTAGATVIRDTTVGVTYTAGAIAGVGAVTLTWSPETTPRTNTFTSYPVTTPSTNVTLTVPSTTPIGPATLQIAIGDRAGRTYAMPSHTFNVIDNTAPVVSSFTIAPGASIYAGRDVTATVITNDDVAVKTVTLDAKLNGTSIKTQTFTPNALSATSIFTVTIAPETAGGSLTIDVTVTDGFPGRLPTMAQQVVTILQDTVGPQVTIVSPSAGATYREGLDKVPVSAIVTDAEVSVKEVSARFDALTPVALTRVAVTNEWRADLTAPPVDGEQDAQRQLTVTAKDYAGNITVTPPVPLTIKPIIDPNAPLLTLNCTSPGALYPPGFAVKVRVTAKQANAQNPLQGVTMFDEDTQAALVVTSLGSDLFEGTYAVPSDAADGRVFRVRVVATSSGGATKDLLTSFAIAVPTIAPIVANLTIDAANTTYENKTVIVQSGTVTIRGPHTFDRLIVLGGRIEHLAGEKLDITTTRDLYVACAGTINATAKGYAPSQRYPGATAPGGGAGGSHIGRGGVTTNPSGSTYGSVYRPAEAGGGGEFYPAGGGIIRIKAGTVHVEGAIAAAGELLNRGGAGGSIWITAGRISGSGTIDARGGGGVPAGGGGAIAIEYTDPASVLPSLQHASGAAVEGRHRGGAGSTYIRGPQSTFGDLIVDNGTASNQGTFTELPSLGSGIALSGTTGATLMTAADVPAYFAGHWVEITRGGTLVATWRIASVSGKSVTLEAPAAVQIGDAWQGVYRFDNVSMLNASRIDSADPIRATGELVLTGGTSEEQLMRVPVTASNVTVNGRVTAKSIVADSMTVKLGAVLMHESFGSGVIGGLTIDVKNALTVIGSISATGRGYAPSQRYPGATAPASSAGGSHIGRGGIVNDNPSGSTYGSVYRPAEAGGGGEFYPAGGGIIRIKAGSVQLDGTIAAVGELLNRGGAGGSIWITAWKISGSGTIDVRGGAGVPTGGGGAIAIEYTDPTSVVPSWQHASGANADATRRGGAGSTYIRGPLSTFGDLIVDNGTASSNMFTELPSLGNGIAQSGTGGATLITNRAADVPAYFIGHWVEITRGGTLVGTWRIVSVSGKNFTLDAAAIVQPNDQWQGVYRFDNVTVLNASRFDSVDPIRTTGELVLTGGASEDQLMRAPVTAGNVTINGRVATKTVTADSMTVNAGAVLTHESLGTLTIDVKNALIVKGSISATARGYAASQRYPGATAPGSAAGGSHIGRGGVQSAASGSTFGSVYRPAEAGGGGESNGTGGGILSINAGTLQVDGTIAAAGESNARGGAGGSIRITVNKITGSGSIDVRGGAASQNSSGGGGAISIAYTDATSIVPIARASTATATTTARHGAAGTVYVFGPQSTFGDVTIDNTGFTRNQATQLPSLGIGNAIAGTNGAMIVTDRATDIAAYFAGHWVDVFAPGGALKGTWRIASVNAKTFTLEGATVNVAVGDRWRGVYLFDNWKQRNSIVQLLDDVRATRDLDVDSQLTINNAPVLNESLIATHSSSADFVRGTAGAVTDLQPPIALTATNVRTGAISTATAASDGSFAVPVVGQAGDTFTLFAVDSYTLPARSLTIAVSGALQQVDDLASIGVQSSTVAGGTSLTGTVRMLYPVKTAAAGVIALTRSDPSVTIPASVTVPVGATSATFNITTSSVAADTTVTLTATSSVMARSTSLVLLASTSALTDIALDAPSVEGGTSINGTATLGAPAPPGGASVAFASSDLQLATVPPFVVIPAGATSAAFTITTFRQRATAQVTITGAYGATLTRTATLTHCTALSAVAPSASIALDATWLDDSLPAGATKTGDGDFDTTQTARGTAAVHLTGAGVHTFAFTGATPLTVGPDDRLVLYALVNPCNPPRQILVGWKAGTAQYRASWGESRIEPTTAHTIAGALPRGGEWVRLELLAKSLGIAGSVAMTELSIRTQDGEAWFDVVGKSACAITTATQPAFNPNEIVWFDDALPAGAIGDAPFLPFDSTQHASGLTSHREPLANDWHQHSFDRAVETMAIGRGDLLFTYVYLDPCNPPKQVMLDWYDGSSWAHRAYWGDSLINDGAEGSAERMRVGPLPELGKWIRLEVPAALVNMEGRAASGAAFVLFNGQAWFDRSGRIPRMNMARGKTARQSSGTDAALVIDGVMDNFNSTSFTNEPFWEVDLGTPRAIESLQITYQLSNLAPLWLLISDSPLPDDLTNAKLQASIAIRVKSASTFFDLYSSGRYVRIQAEGTKTIQLREVEIWTPASAARVNLAIGRVATQSSTSATNDRAEAAVDGSSTNYQVTNVESRPWWQVDLGALRLISTISMFKPPCCTSPLTNFYVLVSDDAMTGTLDEILLQPAVRAYYSATAPMIAGYPIEQRGRYIRIQATGSTGLGVAEVQVWSQQPTLAPLSRTGAPER